MFIVSGCLMGINCKYNGGNNLREYVVKFCESHSGTSVCPESVNLMAPREPAEIVTDRNGSFRVVNKSGEDLTKAFIDGAKVSLRKAEEYSVSIGEPIEGAILKAKSPSCGVGKIYNGEFNDTLVDGNGVFTEMLLEEYNRFLEGYETLVEGVKFGPDFRVITEKDME